MRLFVCEFVTGGGMADKHMRSSLSAEGDLMLRSLVKDLADLGGIDLVLSRDARLAADGLGADIVWVGEGEDPWPIWSRLIDDADALWPIAPETDGSLARLSQMAVTAGRVLIGSSPVAIQIAASKSATAKRLVQCEIPAVPTVRLSASGIEALGVLQHGRVVKPDDGAGAEATRLIERRSDVAALSRQEDAGRFVLQPFVSGDGASVSVVRRGAKVEVLSCNRQHVHIENGSFHYLGWEVGGMEALRPQLEPIAHAVSDAVPGLSGYFGIDFIVSHDGPLVLEVNPRLTTTYAALRESVGRNPAALVLGRHPLGDGRSPVGSTLLELARHG